MWEDKNTELDVAEMKRTSEPYARTYVANFYMSVIFLHVLTLNLHAV